MSEVRRRIDWSVLATWIIAGALSLASWAAFLKWIFG